MKWISFLSGLVLCQMTSFAQVGIGTTTPNSKSLLDLSSNTRGLLIPRMTGAEKTNMALTSDDAGMMIFQTDIFNQTPKGLYTYDGTGWVIPVANGTSNGQTIRWDGIKWAAASNLFNQGSSVGIGTSSPNFQLQIHSSSASTTRIQLTSGAGNSLASDGLLLGVTLGNNYAHLIQQENKPLWFGTNGIERMRIDSAGNVGINKTNPSATLDVNGNAKVTSLNVNGAVTVNANGTGGLLLGLTQPNNYGHLIQQDNKPLWFGTNGIERMRIDSAGKVGINKTNPTATLDVNGNAKVTSLNVNGAVTVNANGTGGLLLGLTQPNNYGRLIQQDNKPLWLGTNGIERMRIDSAGNVGINKTNPSATLDVNGNAIVTSINVNGTSTLGTNGTALNSIIRSSIMIDIPMMDAESEYTYSVPISNVMEGGSVLISPSQPLAGIMIGYARVSSTGNVEIKFMNMATTTEDPANTMFYITVIQ